MRLCGGIFMGIIFLTVGIILLLNSFFNFNINMFKLIIGIVIKKIEINTIFAEGKVILNPDVPTLIKASSAFGELKLPDRSSVVFGSQKYRIGEVSANQGYLEIEASAVFGALKFITTN